MERTILKINLQNLIVGAGYTITEFANKAKINRTHLHRIINGDCSDIKGTKMLKIAGLLNKRVEDIWEITQD